MKKHTQKEHPIKHKSLENALMAFRHTMTSALAAEAKESDCSLAHFEILKFIAENGNPTMKDIARQAHVTPPSASTLIDTLVTKQLVTRSHTTEDRRSIRVMLTTKAQMLLSSLYKKKSSLFNKMLSKLSKEDKTELARILTKCIQ